MISKNEREAQILKNSLEREKKLVEHSIKKTKEKLKDFEYKHGVNSEEFFREFEEGKTEDSQELMLWASEFEALKLLEKDKETIERMLKMCG